MTVFGINIENTKRKKRKENKCDIIASGGEYTEQEEKERESEKRTRKMGSVIDSPVNCVVWVLRML